VKISNVIVTARLGGLDVMVNAFLQQTMPVTDWELIVIDEFYADRKDLLAKVDLPIRHYPAPSVDDFYDNTRALNVGATYCAGELVTYLTDYCWVYPEYLDTHWRWYERLGCGMTHYLDRYAPPPLHTDSDQRWTVFEREFNAVFAKEYFDKHTPEYQERKGRLFGQEIEFGLWEIPGHVIYFIGDSIPLVLLKTLNGWDQQYDGGRGINDIDLAVRANALGWRWVLNVRYLLYKLGTQESLKAIPKRGKPYTRTSDENYQLYLARINAINAGLESIVTPIGRGAWS